MSAWTISRRDDAGALCAPIDPVVYPERSLHLCHEGGFDCSEFLQQDFRVRSGNHRIRLHLCQQGAVQTINASQDCLTIWHGAEGECCQAVPRPRCGERCRNDAEVG